jgi:hypothetical protein
MVKLCGGDKILIAIGMNVLTPFQKYLLLLLLLLLLTYLLTYLLTCCN